MSAACGGGGFAGGVGGLVGGVVEGEVAAGDVAEGGGAALVEGLGVAEVAEALGFGADGVVEVEGVEVVELAGDGAGAGDADAVVVDGEVGLVPGGAAAFFGFLGHVPGDGFLQKPVDLAGADLVGDRGEVPVDVPGGLDREMRCLVGDPAGFPGGQVTTDDAFPQPGQAVAQLQGVADVAFAGLGGQGDGGGELGEGELRDQGCAGSGQRDGGVAEGAQPDGLGLLDGLRGVGDRPVHGGLQEVGLGPVGLPAVALGRTPTARRIVRQPWLPRPARWSWVHSSSDHRHSRPRNARKWRESPCSTGVRRNSGARTFGLRPPATSPGFVTGLAALLNQRWAGSRLVVTTRRRLSTLSAHHEVHELVLAPLDPGATCDLIHTGSSAPSACRPGDLRPGAWRGGWPLLLRHAAGKLALRPSQTMTAIVAELDGARAGRPARRRPAAGRRLARHGVRTAHPGRRATVRTPGSGVVGPRPAQRPRSRSRRIRWLANRPGEPITQPPGWVPEPHW